MRLRLSNLLREDEKRFHRSASVFFSNRGAAFHSSSKTLRRSPVDFQLSQIANQQILKGDAYAFSERYADFFRLDIKMGFTLNSAKYKLSQSIFFDIQNITNRKNVFAERYNPITNNINTAYQIGFFPNFVYKIQF